MQRRYHDYTWRAAVNVLSAESISTIYELAASIDDAIRINGWQRLVGAIFQLFDIGSKPLMLQGRLLRATVRKKPQRWRAIEPAGCVERLHPYTAKHDGLRTRQRMFLRRDRC